MKSYLSLISEYEKVHKKKNNVTLLCIAISVCLVTTIFGMADMGIRSELNYQVKANGNYHITLNDIDEETVELIGSRVDVAVSGWVIQGGIGVFKDKQLSFIGANEEIASEMNLVLQEGVYPVKEDEALLNSLAMKQNNLAVGEAVRVTLPDGSSKVYKIVGVFNDFGTLLEADTYGFALSESGVRAIVNEEFVARYYIQFKSGVNMRNAIEDIKSVFDLSDVQVSENAALLGLLGYSNSSLMIQLYITALVLACLVLIAGTIMIAANFNTNVRERIQFFGLLQCLGASKKQVKRYVYVEGLRQSLKGIPIGLVIGQCIIWIACAYLKYVNSAFFSEIPLFQISGISYAVGIVMGFFTVLLAALSPAKKASKVSMLTAVSGNADVRKIAETVNTKHLPIETRMGMSHALSSKRNLILMTCSFAISIILFLSFYVMVSFLHQAMPALQPYSSDLSINLADNSLPLDTSLVKKIHENTEVKRVYGRMVAYNVPFTSEKGEGTITLISYEDYQFGWAKDELVEGDLEDIKEGQNNVLSVYGNGIEWNLDDTVTLNLSSGDMELTVDGILSATSYIYNNGESNMGYFICSEETFTSLMENNGYMVIEVQLENSATDETVSEIRSMFPERVNFSDKRLSNSEAQTAYYTGATFVYGFLIVIALITVINILNSLNASVSARIQQYGIMRSIGMSTKQLYRMVAAEAATYAVFGCVFGCILGVPVNRLLFLSLITSKWGIAWQIPVSSLLLAVMLCIVSAAIAILRPIKQIRNMTIVETIKI